MNRRSRALTFLALLGLLAAFLSGCGIRPTSVPVDAGAAPSQTACVLPDDGEPGPGGADGRAVRLYLVCGSRVSPVDRWVSVPGGSDASRPATARALLRVLEKGPNGRERPAGFKTSVPRDLSISGPASGDPDETLRLSSSPAKLPSFALAQLVCTYAETAATSTGETVVLGGPAKTDPRPRRYDCSTALRTHPEAARTAGTPITTH